MQFVAIWSCILATGCICLSSGCILLTNKYCSILTNVRFYHILIKSVRDKNYFILAVDPLIAPLNAIVPGENTAKQFHR
jgi:hypothetical protein